jgi:xanthine dehydrogenase accessory factor
VKEIKDIVQSFDEAQKQSKQTALATVVHLDGSSYRRPGARMLITEEGHLTGAISGGCLEGDALRKALLVMTEKRTMLVTYDTMDEDDAQFGIGLGCNGIIQVLIEPVDPADPGNPIQLLKTVLAKRQKAVLVTLFSLEDKKNPQPGTCLLLTEDGNICDTAPFLNEVLLGDAKKVFTNQYSSFKSYITDTNSTTAFIEFIKPAVSLIAIGAGNDVIPLVKMADVLGWDSTVVDGRANYVKQERFPSSCQVLLSKPENVLRQIRIDDQTVFVIMTHNYNYDMAMLKALIFQNVIYIGMLGPRKKLDRILEELNDEGVSLTAKQVSVIHGPVGLDIGAETPEEIALSIISEIKAVLSGREGKLLKDSEGTIHSRAYTVIEEVKLTSKNKTN